MPKWGQDRKPVQSSLPRQTDYTSDGEKSAAASFKERVAQYNELLASDPAAAEVYAHDAVYADRTEYRKARGK